MAEEDKSNTKGRRFAIGDIHGCAKTFRYMIEQELKITNEDKVYLLGDYIDRGPDSKGVLDYIMELKEKLFTIETLRGNHEEMLMEAVIKNNTEFEQVWLWNGGEAALKSFGVLSAKDIPEKYIRLMQDCKYYIELDDYYLVHAGFDFSSSLPFEDKYSMVWIRNMEVDSKKLNGKKLVHGHTPTPVDVVVASLMNKEEPEINLDTGCVYNYRDDMGYLAALNLDSMQLHLVENKEKE